MKSNKLILILLFCCVFILSLYSRSFFTGKLVIIENSAAQVHDQNLKQFAQVIETQVKINKVSLLVAKFISAQHLDKKDYIEENIRDQIAEIEREPIFGTYYHDEEGILYQYFIKNWIGYKMAISAMVIADKAQKPVDAQQHMEDSLLYLERLNGGMKMIVAFHEKDVEERTRDIISTAQLSQQDVLLFTITVLLIFLGIAISSFSKIISTENQLRQQVDQMAAKNLLLMEQSTQIHQLAYHDALCGLPNRRYFQEMLSAEINEGRKGAVIFFDMDNFKVINDTYGHDVGDRFLVIIADQIKQILRDEVFGARLGGDEFVLWLRGGGREDTRLLLEELLHLFAVPIKIDNIELLATASIGVALYPEHGSSMVDLLKKADIAMYQAKAKQSRFVIFKNDNESNVFSMSS